MKITLAYLAGAIDADGYFGIKRWIVLCKTGSFPRFVGRIGLSELHPEIPKLLARTLGGSVRLTKRTRCHPTWQDLWTWSVDSRLAASAARKLIPYLIVKRRQAKLLLELQRHIEADFRVSTERYGRQGRRLTTASIGHREILWNRMKRLNH